MRKLMHTGISLFWLLIAAILIAVPMAFAAHPDRPEQQENLPEVYVEALGSANLRSGPATDYAPIGEIISGTEYRVLARHSKVPWLLLEIPSIPTRAGWVYETLVQVTRGSLAQVPYENEFYELPVVSDAPVATPTTSQPLIAPPIQAEATATVIPPAATLIPATATSTYAVIGTLKGRSNVRYGPGIDYPIVITLEEGTVLPVLARHSQYPWLKVGIETVPTGSGWLHQDLIDITGDIYTLDVVTVLQLPYPTPTATPDTVVSQAIPWSNFGAVNSAAMVTDLGEPIHRYLLNADLPIAPRSDREVSLFALNLNTEQHIVLNGDVAYSGMSINKIPILVAYFLNLDAPLTLEQATLVATTMICSENITTNRLIAEIGDGDEMAGAARVTAMMEQLNLNDSFVLTPYSTGAVDATPVPQIEMKTTDVDQSRTNADTTNQMTVQDIGWLLGAVYQCATEGSGALVETFPDQMDALKCRQVLRAMNANRIGTLLEAGVPPGTQVAHKHGWIRDTIGDAGIIFAPENPYVLVMVYHEYVDPDSTGWVSADYAFNTLEYIAQLVWNYMNPNNTINRTYSTQVSETCDIYADTVVTDLLSGTTNLPGIP